MRFFCIGLLLLTHEAVGHVGDSIQLDSLPKKSNFKVGAIIELGVTPTLVELPAFRSFLRSNQIRSPSPLKSYFNSAFGLRYGRTKLLMQTNYSLFDGFNNSNSYSTGSVWVVRSQTTINFGLNAGFDVLNARNHRLYVGAGMGGLGFDYSLYLRSTQTIPFNAVLQTTPLGSVPSLSLRNVGYFEAYLEYSQREKRKRSVENVIRVGYRTGTYQKAWESDVYQFSDPIRDRASQFYLQGTFSFSINAGHFLQSYTKRSRP